MYYRAEDMHILVDGEYYPVVGVDRISRAIKYDNGWGISEVPATKFVLGDYQSASTAVAWGHLEVSRRLGAIVERQHRGYEVRFCGEGDALVVQVLTATSNGWQFVEDVHRGFARYREEGTGLLVGVPLTQEDLARVELALREAALEAHDYGLGPVL